MARKVKIVALCNMMPYLFNCFAPYAWEKNVSHTDVKAITYTCPVKLHMENPRPAAAKAVLPFRPTANNTVSGMKNETNTLAQIPPANFNCNFVSLLTCWGKSFFLIK